MGEETAETIRDWIARAVGHSAVSDWTTVDQAMISGFADVTRDWNFLHVDPAAARAAGLDSTIAHGFLTLSLLAPMRMSAAAPRIPRLRVGYNYGLDRVRFLSPVRAGSRLRGHFTTVSIVETTPGNYRETTDVTVEIEGEERPALVATWLTIYMT